MSQEFTLTRTGDRPLVFAGEKIAEVDGRIHSGQEQNRWHEIRAYRTDGGKYVLEIEYCTCWQGEDGHSSVTVHDTPTALVNELKSYYPLEYVLGYPPHPQFTEKQARLENSLQLRWRTLVSELLAAIPGTAEKIG